MILAESVGPYFWGQEFARNHPVVAAVLAVLLLIVLIAVLVWWIAMRAGLR